MSTISIFGAEVLRLASFAQDDAVFTVERRQLGLFFTPLRAAFCYISFSAKRLCRLRFLRIGFVLRTFVGRSVDWSMRRWTGCCRFRHVY